MLESGFHRLTLIFGLASVAVWTYVFHEWLGGEWWGLLLAIAAAIPVGLVVAILPSILFTTLRRLPLVNDALLTGVFMLGGLVLGVYALIAFDGRRLRWSHFPEPRSSVRAYANAECESTRPQ